MHTYHFFLCFIITTLYNFLQAQPQQYTHYLRIQYDKHQTNAHSSDQYKELIATHPSPYIYKGYLEQLFEEKKYTEITRLAPTTSPIFPQDKSVQIILGQAFELTGNTRQAEKIFIDLYQYHKESADVAYYAAAAQARQGHFKEALEIIHDFLKIAAQTPNFFLLYMLKAKIHQELKQPDLAQASMTKGMELYNASGRGIGKLKKNNPTDYLMTTFNKSTESWYHKLSLAPLGIK